MVGLTRQDAVFTKGYTLHHDDHGYTLHLDDHGYPVHHDDHDYPLHHDEHQEEHDDSGDGMIMVKLHEII